MISKEQRAQLFREGFVVIPNVVSKTLVNEALRSINHQIGKGFSKEEVKSAEMGSWCPSLIQSPNITNLFNISGVSKLVSSAIGAKIRHQFAGQIALRFPGTLCSDKKGTVPVPYWNKLWHIDGFHSPQNGIPKGEIRNFTCLVGIMLSDVDDEFCGNFVVFPKSHHILEQYFNETGFKQAESQGLSSFAKLPFPRPIQVKAKAGDVILAHYMLAHSIAPNCSPHIRYAIYFRVNMREDNKFHPEPMSKIWTDWKGMYDVLRMEGSNRFKWIDEVKKETPIQPAYVDDIFKSSSNNSLLQYSQRMDQKLHVANELFEKHDIEGAKIIFKEIFNECVDADDDFTILLKASYCFTFSVNPDDVLQGEKLTRKCISMAPQFPNCYTLLAQNLFKQKKYKEVPSLVLKMLDCPIHDEKSADTIMDGIACARDALEKLNQLELLNPLIAHAKKQHPQLGQQIDQSVSDSGIQQLWIRGQQWIHSPVKDFNHGYQLFSQIANKKPNDYWAILLMGGCKTWGGQASLGEQHIRDALKLNRSLPNAFCLLAQNLLLQGRWKESISIVEEMMNETFSSVSTNKDHGQKIIEALECAKKILGRNARFMHLVQTAKLKYRNLSPQLDKF